MGIWRIPLICVGLIAMVFAVFGQTIHHGFINFDDGRLVFENAHVLKGVTWENINWAMIAGTPKAMEDSDYWRPISILSQMADVQFFGLHAGAHHAVNVLLQALNSVLLFLILRSMTGAIWRSAIVAALFAIHPLHVESVAWISERKDLLCGLFFLLTLGAYIRFARKSFGWGNYLLVLLLSALAMASKPMVVTLPFVLILLDYWPLQRAGKVSLSRLLLEKAPFVAMGFMVSIITMHAPGGQNRGVMDSLSLPWRVGNALVAYSTYLCEMLWPVGLSAFYPHFGTKLPLSHIWLSVATLLVITTQVFWHRRRRYLIVGWLWYLGMLLPVIGIVQSGEQSHADRYTYLPLIGIFVMLVWALADWSEVSEIRRRFMVWTGATFLMVFMVLSARQTILWSDDLKLWSHAVKSGQESALAHNNLGNALMEKGRKLESLEEFKKSLKLDPNYELAHASLGFLLFQMSRFDEAEDELRKALAINPLNPIAHNNLGNVLFAKGKLKESITEYWESMRLDPNYIKTRYNLGDALFSDGKKEEGVLQYRQALTLDKSSTKAQIKLGEMLQQMGRKSEAFQEYQLALKHDPRSVAALSDFAKLNMELGRRSEGIALMERALLLQPLDSAIANDLAWMLATASESDLRDGNRALKLAQMALDQSGGKDPSILDTLAAAYAETGEFVKALECARHGLIFAESSGDKNLEVRLKKEIVLYESGKPLRDPP